MCQKVGFIGMGNMGLHMATNLVKNGFDVKGFDMNEMTLAKAKKVVSDSHFDSLSHFYVP